MIRKTVLGGGKSLVKSICYVIVIVNFILSVCFIKSDIVSARKPANQKSSAKESTKRAAVNKKNTKRAATNGKNNKRAANSRAKKVSEVRKQKNSRAMRALAARTETETETESVVVTDTKTEVKGPVCPVEKVISRKYDDNGEFLFYDKKELCSEPENASIYKWSTDLKSTYPLNGVSSSDAYYYKCNSGYIVKTVDGVRSCVNVFQTCPLNVVVEKNDEGYVSSETGEQCDLPSNADVRLVKSGENTRGDLDDASAYIIECKANKYSAPIEGAESDLHLQCLSCPEGYLSPVGSKSKDKCMENCKDGKVAGDDGKCVSCDENATYADGVCICKNGYYGKGYGTDACVICPAGSICTGGEKKDVNKGNNEYTNTTGQDKAKTCPEGSKSTGTSCTCNDSNYTFDINSNTCNVSKCNAGQMLEGGKCVDCPAGYYCSGDNNKTACSAGTYNASTGAKSADACVKCEDYHWSDAGASKCGKIKIHLWYSYWNDDNDVNKACTLNKNKWFETETKVEASNDNFGGDPKEHKKKGAGAPCWHIAEEGQTINLNCVTLPCTIQGPGGRYLKVTADRKFECAESDGKFWECSGGKAGSDIVKWD